jgi:hypothetical protein
MKQLTFIREQKQKMAAIDFATEYRLLQPHAQRDVISARSQSFTNAADDANHAISRIVDLAYFAFQLPLPTDSDAKAWFGGILKSHDELFSIDVEVEEAARIATLVLRNRLAANVFGTPVLVHAAAFAGKRQTVDDHTLSRDAQRALADLVRRRGGALARPKLGPVTPVDVTAVIAEYRTEGTETTDVDVHEALLQDYSSQISELFKTANTAIDTVWEQNRRLAEEVDLLWWHLGGDSYLLDRPISAVPDMLKPLVVGMDVAQMVTQLPGSYGSYGIIRKALGNLADQQIKLSDAIKALDRDFVGLVDVQVEHYALAPVHAAAAEVLVNQQAVVAAQFKRKTNLNFDIKLTGYELAVQAYHERLLSKQSWIK